MDTNYLTITAAADLLGLSPKTIRRKISSGELPAYRVGRGPRAPIRLKARDVRALLIGFPSA